ncbi:replication stress response regulator SDE2 [Contarinia nasturtii]|uniref:replication stress response regulator SDE2 n=1 Tax=Contarinia nasturtii TaxID=265458 RepID=UPI0012D46BFA|nr:replication stress response regulator SDE2 [Contarinia nasturtii]
MIANVCVDGGHRLIIHPKTNSQKHITEAVSKALNLSPSEFYLTQNGKLINNNNEENNIVDTMGNTIYVCMRLFGGKGGFGSMLRAIGAQIEKTTNREACRDLSGRRLRDINEEKRLKDYLDKKAKEDEEAGSKVARKIERLRSKPKHEFKDDEYFETRSNLLDDVSDALEEGMKNATTSTAAVATSTATTSTSGIGKVSGSNDSNDGSVGGSGVKRKLEKSKKKQKKKLKGAQWLDEGLSSDDSSDSDTDKDDESVDDTSEKSKQSSND